MSLTNDDDETNVDEHIEIVTSNETWTNASMVGNFAPYTSTRVNRNYRANVDDELTVRTSDMISALYREDEWLYVVDNDGAQGFVPAEYCDMLVSDERKTKKKKSIRQRATSLLRRHGSHHLSLLADNSTMPNYVDSNAALVKLLHTSNSSSIDDGSIVFAKRPTTRLMMRYAFRARTIDELTVRECQMVTALNTDDADWIYVIDDERMHEGFVPVNYTTLPVATPKSNNYCCELLVTRRFIAECSHDLSVAPGDWLLLIGCRTIDETTHAMNDGWLWVRRNERNGDEGFVPSVCVTVATVL